MMKLYGNLTTKWILLEKGHLDNTTNFLTFTHIGSKAQAQHLPQNFMLMWNPAKQLNFVHIEENQC